MHKFDPKNIDPKLLVRATHYLGGGFGRCDVVRDRGGVHRRRWGVLGGGNAWMMSSWGD